MTQRVCTRLWKTVIINNWFHKVMKQSEYPVKQSDGQHDDARFKHKVMIQSDYTKWWHKVMGQSDETKLWHKVMTQNDDTNWWNKMMTQRDFIKW